MPSSQQRRLERLAAEITITTQLGSIRQLQRRLHVAFPKAAHLMAVLEERGVVGPHKGDLSRDVLVRPDKLLEVLSRDFPFEDC